MKAQSGARTSVVAKSSMKSVSAANPAATTSTSTAAGAAATLAIGDSNEALSMDELVKRVIDYRNRSNGRLYESINQEFILNLMDKTKIIEIEQSFPSKGLDIIDFVRLFLSKITHKEEETLYITIALVDLFKYISESLNLSPIIQMKHITSVICEQMEEKNNAQYKIQRVLMPEQKRFNIDPTRVRQIDIKPPPIYGRYDEDLSRLLKQKIKTDSMHHHNHRIKTGVYAQEMKRIISLDSLSDRINMYDLEAEFQQYVRPKTDSPTDKISRDIIIFSFAWSERQQRLGATLKDFTLCFWDKYDGFKYEKQIAIQSFMSDYQTNIWYLEFVDCWVTTDAKNQLYGWDLEREVVSVTLSSPLIKHTIFEVCAIAALKLVAVASSDKLITLWDFTQASVVQTIEFAKAGIHSMAYFASYSVLVCGGFQNNITLHQIDPTYLDVNLKGSLIGHQSMVTAFDCIEKTPMIVSSDDSGIIKIWDVRTMKCIQTLDCGQQTVITKILNIYLEGKLCFLGTRINLIDFDEAETIVKRTNTHDDLFPIKVENSQDSFIIVTRKDIRFVDIKTGKIKEIFVGLLSEGEDEITAFKQIEQGRKFILGNHRGELSLHSIQNGEKLRSLHAHTNEVTSIRIDYLNKLLISCGWDSNIKIQYLTDANNTAAANTTTTTSSESPKKGKVGKTPKIKKNLIMPEGQLLVGSQEVEEELNPLGTSVIREAQNCFFNKEITNIEVSVYHNLIFAASNSETIYVFDYEFVKLISAIQLDQKTDVQSICVVNGFSLVLIATNDGNVSILHFSKKEFVFSAKLIACLDLRSLIAYQLSPDKSEFVIPTKSPLTIAGATSNQAIVQQLLNSKDDQSNINAGAGLGNNASDSKKTGILFANRMLLDCSLTDPVASAIDTKLLAQSTKAGDQILEGESSSMYSQQSRSHVSAQKLSKFTLYCSLNKGDLLAIDLLPMVGQFNDITHVEHCNTRTNYNAFRGYIENFLKGVEQIQSSKIVVSRSSALDVSGRRGTEKELNRSIYESIRFYRQGAHRDTVTSLKMITLGESFLMSSSMDCYMKIWDKSSGELRASRNVNHPLPIVWNIAKDRYQDGRKKVVFALKVLDVISKKYSKTFSYEEQRNLRVTNFIADIIAAAATSSQQPVGQGRSSRLKKNLNLSQILAKDNNEKLLSVDDSEDELTDEDYYDEKDNTTADKSKQKKKKKRMQQRVMRDDFSPRDLKFEQSKKIFERELLGPSLKRMEANKRAVMVSRAWKMENETKEAQIQSQLRNSENPFSKNHKIEERDDLIAFIDQKYRDKLLGNDFTKESEEFTQKTQDLHTKLNVVTRRRKNARQLSIFQGSEQAIGLGLGLGAASSGSASALPLAGLGFGAVLTPPTANQLASGSGGALKTPSDQRISLTQLEEQTQQQTATAGVSSRKKLPTQQSTKSAKKSEILPSTTIRANSSHNNNNNPLNTSINNNNNNNQQLHQNTSSQDLKLAELISRSLARKAKPTKDLYSYAETKDYIDASGTSLIQNKIVYPPHPKTIAVAAANLHQFLQQQSSTHNDSGSLLANSFAQQATTANNRSVMSNADHTPSMFLNNSLLSNAAAGNGMGGHNHQGYFNANVLGGVDQSSQLLLQDLHAQQQLKQHTNNNSTAAVSQMQFDDILLNNTNHHDVSQNYQQNSHSMNENSLIIKGIGGGIDAHRKSTDATALFANAAIAAAAATVNATSSEQIGGLAGRSKNYRLSQLMRSMDLKVKKAQQSFADESIIVDFLAKRGKPLGAAGFKSEFLNASSITQVNTSQSPKAIFTTASVDFNNKSINSLQQQQLPKHSFNQQQVQQQQQRIVHSEMNRNESSGDEYVRPKTKSISKNHQSGIKLTSVPAHATVVSNQDQVNDQENNTESSKKKYMTKGKSQSNLSGGLTRKGLDILRKGLYEMTPASPTFLASAGKMSLNQNPNQSYLSLKSQSMSSMMLLPKPQISPIFNLHEQITFTANPMKAAGNNMNKKNKKKYINSDTSGVEIGTILNDSIHSQLNAIPEIKPAAFADVHKQRFERQLKASVTSAVNIYQNIQESLDNSIVGGANNTSMPSILPNQKLRFSLQNEKKL